MSGRRYDEVDDHRDGRRRRRQRPRETGIYIAMGAVAVLGVLGVVGMALLFWGFLAAE